MIDILKCKLLEYSVLLSGKILWGLDCEVEQLRIEVNKIYRYIYLLESLQEPNDCKHIPIKLQQKIKNYINQLSKNKSLFCNDC
jgi:hypothetical protein